MSVSEEIRHYKRHNSKWHVYHRGYLPRDKRSDQFIRELSGRLLMYEKAGLVYLMQKRQAPMCYTYYVKWRRK